MQHAMRQDHAQSVLPADLPLYGHYVFIEATTAVAHVSKVTEDECPVDIKPTGNDVFTVLPGKALGLLDIQTSIPARQRLHEASNASIVVLALQ